MDKVTLLLLFNIRRRLRRDLADDDVLGSLCLFVCYSLGGLLLHAGSTEFEELLAAEIHDIALLVQLLAGPLLFSIDELHEVGKGLVV